MYSQNVNLFKGNKYDSPSQLQIYQLLTPQPCPPPPFASQAAQPLDLNYEQIKLVFQKSTTNHVNLQTQNKFILHLNQDKLLSNEQILALRQENNTLKRDLSEINKLYEEQKQKYNQLKNLYKDGQSMFQALEEKKAFLEKENKQLRQILEKLYKQLHLKNYQFEDEENIKDKKAAQNKIQKVKIGNKKIPVIKVNVPPQTFVKKEHTNSVFSHVSGQQYCEINEEQISSYKQEILRLHDTNQQLEKELNEVKMEFQEFKKINENIGKSYKGGYFKEDFMFKALKEQPLIKQRKSSTIQTAQNNVSNSTFGFQVSSFQNQSIIYSNNQPLSNYKESDNLSYFKSKYDILETELQKKDEALKSLYNQCYLLQAQINKLKSHYLQSVLTKEQGNKDIGQGWSKQKHPQSFQFSRQEQFRDKQWRQREQRDKGNQFQRRKINQLETKVNQLNQMCISNINQTFRINEQNDTISKLTRENSSYHEKIMTLEIQITRLYKILENKNSQLSQIYTSITQSKRNYPIDASKKKSFDNIFANTPEKLNQFSTTKIFYSKGHSKDNSFH